MTPLIEIQREADLLTEEERAGLAAHLLATISSAPPGADDEEVDQRDIEMDSGEVSPISHAEFIRQVNRG